MYAYVPELLAPEGEWRTGGCWRARQRPLNLHDSLNANRDARQPRRRCFSDGIQGARQQRARCAHGKLIWLSVQTAPASMARQRVCALVLPTEATHTPWAHHHQGHIPWPVLPADRVHIHTTMSNARRGEEPRRRAYILARRRALAVLHYSRSLLARA